MMGHTAKYCEDCDKKMSPANASPREKEYIRASSFTEGTIPIGSGPRTEEGVCDKCGKSGIVIYYET